MSLAQCRLGVRPCSRLVLCVATVFLVSCNQQAETAQVTLVSWGGKYQQLLMDGWVLPSAAKTSPPLAVRGESHTGEYKIITDMIQSGTVPWDLVEVETFYAAFAKNRDLLTRFDPPVPAEKLVLTKDALSPYAYPANAWSYVLAWKESVVADRSGGSAAPSHWSDFWDIKQFPGPRALRDVPQGNIEIALLADGMSKEAIQKQLYHDHDLTLVDRALRKLSTIRKHTVWWNSGDQLQRELETGHVTLAAAWNGRVWLARQKNEPGGEGGVNLTYNDAILDYDWWIIPRGAKAAGSASVLIGRMYDDIAGAITFARQLGYGPPVVGWEKQIADGDPLLHYMPTSAENLPKQLLSDPAFWAQYHTEISDRWEKWRAQ